MIDRAQLELDMAAGAPGRWEASEGDHWWQVQVADGQPYAGQVICDLNESAAMWRSPGDDQPDNFSEANARLIALAPELAAAHLSALDRIAELERALNPAARDVLAERHRQIADEGWTPEHDDTHDGGEMARAASCYAGAAGTDPKLRRDIEARVSLPENLWPWKMEWWKPTTRRRDLVKAGALILAEIDRLDRAAREVLRKEGA